MWVKMAPVRHVSTTFLAIKTSYHGCCLGAEINSAGETAGYSPSMSQPHVCYHPTQHTVASIPCGVCALHTALEIVLGGRLHGRIYGELSNYSSLFHSLPLWPLSKTLMEKAIYLQGQIVRAVFY